MENTKRKMIQFLLSNANPSIKKRIKSEILNHLTEEENKEYQVQILNEPNVRRCLACQLDNGWFGYGFHGTNKNAGQFENQETCTKYLGEKAVDPSNPALKRSMDAFVSLPLDDLCYRTKGKYFDEFQYAANGQNLIRCACIARAGYADIIDITPQIQLSLDSFQRVLEVDSILDVSRSIRSSKYRVFHDYEKWPCRYHLDILAHTDTWKNKQNCAMLAEAVKKIMAKDRPELVGLTAASWVGHVLGTLGCFPSQGFGITLPGASTSANGKTEYYDFEYIEWLARCGVVPYIPVLQDAVADIEKSVDGNGICQLPVLEEKFKGWGPYAGLQLETDWKSKTRKACDITFRALLILHYAEQN